MASIGRSRWRRAAVRAARASSLIDGLSWRNPGFPQTDRHPVTCVSWDDAQAYVSWLGRTAGAEYRLPAEAEWGTRGVRGLSGDAT